MRDKQSLRDFQAQLAEKLKAAQTATGPSSKLGFIAGGRHWLVSLEQINEVVTVPELLAVPWAQPWFSGVASVRGALYGCTDLGAFLKLSGALPRGEAHLLLAHPRFGVNAALRIERTLGLRAVDGLLSEPAPDTASPWVSAHWRGLDGQVWAELNLEKLVAAPVFLEAGL
ncbi:MAG: twitching motility protein PilI [Hydrogenophilales bacterium CG17_big_fil_post_rev_8_21_14_2_50_63_12]|nr:MAG: twitching motility protein PilI [Hydrogenophilales bacterium CG17_big_fil_post_rev_8_21_14_2_50_63_12]PIX96115.1 MAG: twitching motility protein PilI [Hydrogenophilales bacterium CG_4_10_14_3_um_filter_63_21]PJB04623.1 MAG: twitching motility protein PilI [Hydrogenophilales bacterium CG_4_9_14_3_um_filter_63_34]